MKLLAAFLALCVLSYAVHAADADRCAAAARAVNAFAVAHHRLLPPGNALTSPLSIETCLAMTYAGADGSTREAMRKAFFYPEDNVLHPSFQAIRQSLLPAPGAAKIGNIRFANQVFYAQGLTLLPGWTTIIRSSYFAAPAPVDFPTDPAGAEKIINQWVSAETDGKIPIIIPPGKLKPQTQLVLVNAVYFDMPWEEQFTKELTQTQPFRLHAMQYKTVPLMFKQHRLGYARKDGFQIAALPYAGGVYQFVVILPDTVDGLGKIERLITGDLLTECARLKPAEVRLSFPRLRMVPPVTSLKGTLTAMGAGVMFGPSANFSRMAKNGDSLLVDDVLHRTYLDLDEDGTKAASSTAAVIRYKNGHSREVPHEVVRAAHPFLFMIQHVPTGACVFLGRITDPLPETPAQDGAPAAPQESSTPKK